MAVTSRNLGFAKHQAAAASGAAGFIVVAALTMAMAGTVFGQNNPPPAAGTAGVPQAAAPTVSPAPPAPPAPAPAASVVVLPPQPPPPGLPGPPTEKRGFLNNFGQWWDQSVANFKAKMKEQQTKVDAFNKQSADAAKNAATATSQAMKSAADAMVRFSTSRIVDVREVCAVAGNGAADCQAAAVSACKSKGFNTGQPLDVRTAEKCTDSLWVSGQNPAPTDCPEETVVLRAACE